MEEKTQSSGWASLFFSLLLLVGVLSLSLASCDTLVDPGDETYESGDNHWPDPTPPPDPPPGD